MFMLNKGYDTPTPPTISGSYSNQNLSNVTSNFTSTPLDTSALYYNAAQTSVTINSGVTVYGGGGSGGSMTSNPNIKAMSRVGVPGNNGQHALVNQTTITTLTNYGSLVGGGGGGGQGTNYGSGGYTPGWNGGNGAAGGGGGGGGAGGPAGGGWGTGSKSNNGNPGTISSGGAGGGDGQTVTGGAGGYGSNPPENGTANCSNGAGGGGAGGQLGGKAGVSYSVLNYKVVPTALNDLIAKAGNYYYSVGGTQVLGGSGGNGGYGIVNTGTITNFINSQKNLYFYNYVANGLTNYSISVSSNGSYGQLYYYGNTFTTISINLDENNIANYKQQTYSSVINDPINLINLKTVNGTLTKNGISVTWNLVTSGTTSFTSDSKSYDLVISKITGSPSKASSKATTGATGPGPAPSPTPSTTPAPVPTPTPSPPPPKPYILSLTNSMTIWSGTNPSNVTQFIWNPTGGITQSNSNSGIADLQPNPTYQSSAGKTTNTWISSGFTLAKGDFIGNSDGSLYLIMNTDGNLNLCTTSYSYYSGVEIPGGRYAGSTGQNAIYKFNEVGNSALINNIYYIDGDTYAYKYPSDYISQGTNYTQFSNIDACGNDLGPTNNSSVSQCEQICDANSNCYGFVLDKNNTCRPKNKNMWPYSNNQIPSQGTNTYLKMNKLIQTPLGVSYNTTNTNSYVAKSYPQASGGIQNAYGLAVYIMSELDKLRILEQNINSMAKEISNNNINIDKNQINILNQANKDKEAIELFIEDYKKIEEGIKKVDNQEYLLVDTDIKLLQENYNYYLWTILAIGIVIVGIHVIKKKPFF